MASSSEEIESAISHNDSRSEHSCWANSVTSNMCFVALVILNFICCVLNLGYCAHNVQQLCPCRLEGPSDSDINEQTQDLCLSTTFVCVFKILYSVYFLLDFLILTCARYPRWVAAVVVTLEWIICLINQHWFPQPTWAFTMAIVFLLIRTVLGIIGDGGGTTE